MTTLTIVLLISLGLVVLLLIIIFLTEKTKAAKDNKDEEEKPGDEKKGDSHGKKQKSSLLFSILSSIIMIGFIFGVLYWMYDTVFPYNPNVFVTVSIVDPVTGSKTPVHTGWTNDENHTADFVYSDTTKIYDFDVDGKANIYFPSCLRARKWICVPYSGSGPIDFNTAVKGGPLKYCTGTILFRASR